MNLYMLVGTISGLLFIAYIIYQQQRTIERLTDRLMARDYREYASMQPKQEIKEEHKRKPMSWYDDADIEEE